jgi:hypothetical protein
MSQSSGPERAINPIEIQGYLKGLNYPANKEAVVARAKESHAPQSILDILNRLPSREYSRPTEISSALGKLK